MKLIIRMAHTKHEKVTPSTKPSQEVRFNFLTNILMVLESFEITEGSKYNSFSFLWPCTIEF